MNHINHINFYTQVVEEIPHKDWVYLETFQWSENLVTPTGVTTTLPIGTRVYLGFGSDPQLSKETAHLLKNHFLLKKSEHYYWLTEEAEYVQSAAWRLFMSIVEYNFNPTQVFTQEAWDHWLSLTFANLNLIIGRTVHSVWERVEVETIEVCKFSKFWEPKARPLAS